VVNGWAQRCAERLRTAPESPLPVPSAKHASQPSVVSHTSLSPPSSTNSRAEHSQAVAILSSLHFEGLIGSMGTPASAAGGVAGRLGDNSPFGPIASVTALATVARAMIRPCASPLAVRAARS
jgi:hypothetical protein